MLITSVIRIYLFQNWRMLIILLMLIAALHEGTGLSSTVLKRRIAPRFVLGNPGSTLWGQISTLVSHMIFHIRNNLRPMHSNLRNIVLRKRGMGGSLHSAAYQSFPVGDLPRGSDL